VIRPVVKITRPVVPFVTRISCGYEKSVTGVTTMQVSSYMILASLIGGDIWGFKKSKSVTFSCVMLTFAALPCNW